MQLMTNELRTSIPALYSQEGKGEDATVYAKFFTPDSNWTWLVLEYDGEDTFFGLVKGFETEYGYFSFSELESSIGPMGLGVERDISFKPCTLKEARTRENMG
jgi:hypothetical protein